MSEEAFEAVRRETDPVSRAQRATELITLYQQRGIELARIRRDAINEAVGTRNLTYTEMAHALGLSKGRITQIRQTAPPAERGLFGVGPITVATPVRALTNRPGGVVAVEDATAAERMTALLTSLAFVVTPFRIPPDGHWDPPPDAVAICGPKSSPVTADAIASDPHLSFGPDDTGRWVMTERGEGQMFTSPMDHGDPEADIAYVGRLRYRGRNLVVIAGIHALGSVGAVDYLTQHLADVFAEVGDSNFSMVVSSRFANGQTVSTEAVWGPRRH